ncbi:hypothetical protein [Tenacibaculum sp. SDUM215027]|uniref:hypothetical protein n=1 Tax=Tenacibaculum sp. SDUM215027 TaxID=3422596 RepID=UPI003D3112B0
MRCLIIILLFFSLIFFNCKKKADKFSNVVTKENSIDSLKTSVIKNNEVTKNKKLRLTGSYDFKKLLGSLKNINHTKNKHKDWVSDYSYVFSGLFELDSEKFQVKTTSYTYKKDLVFYLHNIKCVNDSISIKPFLEKAQGKFTEGYLSNRVFILAMKDDMTANYIDIPEKMNPYKLRLELVDTLYKKINSDVILCYRTKKCVYKDFREKK